VEYEDLAEVFDLSPKQLSNKLGYLMGKYRKNGNGEIMEKEGEGSNARYRVIVLVRNLGEQVNAAPRKYIDHRNHNHPATAAAREVCRRSIANGTVYETTGMTDEQEMLAEQEAFEHAMSQEGQRAWSETAASNTPPDFSKGNILPVPDNEPFAQFKVIGTLQETNDLIMAGMSLGVEGIWQCERIS
jgi:hypothetical protein